MQFKKQIFATFFINICQNFQWETTVLSLKIVTSLQHFHDRKPKDICHDKQPLNVFHPCIKLYSIYSQGFPFPDQERNAVDVVLQYATKKLGFRPEEIVIFAWSIGGYSATYAAQSHPDIKHVVWALNTIYPMNQYSISHESVQYIPWISTVYLMNKYGISHELMQYIPWISTVYSMN